MYNTRVISILRFRSHFGGSEITGLGMMGDPWDYAKGNELHRDLGDTACVRRQRPQEDNRSKPKNRRKTGKANPGAGRKGARGWIRSKERLLQFGPQ